MLATVYRVAFIADGRYVRVRPTCPTGSAMEANAKANDDHSIDVRIFRNTIYFIKIKLNLAYF
jgi:hypothetical protein